MQGVAQGHPVHLQVVCWQYRCSGGQHGVKRLARHRWQVAELAGAPAQHLACKVNHRAQRQHGKALAVALQSAMQLGGPCLELVHSGSQQMVGSRAQRKGDDVIVLPKAETVMGNCEGTMLGRSCQERGWAGTCRS